MRHHSILCIVALDSGCRPSIHPVHARLTLGACLQHQAVVSFTWDSKGRTLSYLHEEHMAESDSLSTHLADLIRRLLLIKLVPAIIAPCSSSMEWIVNCHQVTRAPLPVLVHRLLASLC